MCVKLLCKTNSVYYLKINAYIVLLSHTTLETKKANDIAVNPIFQGSTKGLFEVGFIYSKKATKFWEISTIDLTGTT